jgi:ferric-dicitrate binding protein FerR (iron transport regulator)
MVVTALALFFILRDMAGPSEGKNKKPSTLSQVSTKPGSRTQIQLPDGSVVRLNASSSLTYDKNFGKNIREVNLIGEAFFDVTKDSSHPFIIHTNVVDIKVLGTAFNVRSYPNDANTETSLIRGRVEVTVKNRANEKIYLEPNEKLVVANDNSTLNKTLTDQPERGDNKTNLSPKPIYSVQHLTYYPVDSAIIETSWVDNRLIFQENETFKEVALKMERWYGVQINFAREKVAGYQMFGSFKNETVTQALDELKLGFKFNYKMDGNIITITQ